MVLPVHVIRHGAPGATERWAPLVAKGLAVEEPAVTTDEFDIADLARSGNLGLLAAWRVLRGVPPVDKCVFTSAEQVARLLSHLRVLRKQLAAAGGAGAVPVWAVAEDAAAPSEPAIRALPRLVDALDRLDPAWDVLCLAATDSAASADGPDAVVLRMPGVGAHVALTRLRYMAGTACHLISPRGAEKLLPMLDHADTFVDKVIGLGAHMGLLRVYGAEIGVLGGREPFVPLGADRGGSGSGGDWPGTGGHGIQQPDGLMILFDPWSYVPLWATILFVVSAVAVVALSVALAVTLGRRRATRPTA